MSPRLFRVSFLVLALMSAAPSRLALAGAAYSDSEIQDVVKGDESRVRQIRDQEIHQLQLALKRRIPQNRRADLYFRLAELYLEGYRQEFLLEGRAHEKRIEKGGRGTIDRSRSKPYLRVGVQACEQILKFGLSFPKIDQVYYFLGVNFSELGDSKKAMQAFSRLVSRYPKSEYAAEAYRELGEDAFSRKNYRQALGFLESAATRARPENLPRILHKLAWSYFRTKQYARALESMKSAITKLSAAGEKMISLKEEALRDIAVFFTEAGRVNEALAYFEAVAGDKDFYAKALEKLGKQYERSKDPKRATEVYEAILKTRPEDDAAFRVLAKLVETDLQRKQYTAAAKRLGASVKILPMGDDESGVIAKNLRSKVRKTATESHERYRNASDRPALSVAESFYRIYLERFLQLEDPRHEKPEIQMYLADVLRESGRAKEAAFIYKEVINGGDDRYAKQAGQLWTASLSDAIQKASKKSGYTKGATPSALELEFVEAADELQGALGDQNEGREAAVRAAQVLAGYPGTREEGMKRAKRLMERAPTSSQGLTAARLYLQTQIEHDGRALDELKDALDFVQAVPGLLENDRKNGGKLHSLLRGEQTRIEVGKIAKDEQEKNFEDAGQGYEDFARKQTDAKTAEQAYANAVGVYTRAKDFDRVERVVAEWLKRFPSSDKPVESVRNAATIALVEGAFQQSGHLFERLGRTGRDHASLDTAARIYEGLGDVKAARQIWERAVKLYPQAKDRFFSAQALADSYVGAEVSGEEKVQADFYRYCLGAGGDLEAECGAKLGDLYAKMRDEDQAKIYYGRVAKLGGKGTRARSPYVGYARYRVAELLEKSRSFAPMTLPQAQLQKGLQARLEFLEPLSRAYTSAVEAGGPWAVAALHRLARFAENFADEVDQIEPPQGTAAAVEQFRQGLKSVSGPLRLKAYETWKKAYDQAQENEILSPATIEIGDVLAEGVGGRPPVPRAQGARAQYRLAGIPPSGGNSAMEDVRRKLGQNPKNPGHWIDYGNLLWGEGKPGLARLAYDRALGLKPRDAGALNNRAVVDLAGGGQDEWVTANAANVGFKQALATDDFFIAAKMNRASLLTYYRVFSAARKLWEQVLVKASQSEAHDGLAVALTGLGGQAGAEAAFKRADQTGAAGDRFVRVFHAAAQKRGSDCLDRLGALNAEKTEGFERVALDHLKLFCSR